MKNINENYLISESGEVYSLINNKFLKPGHNGVGYLCVSISKVKGEKRKKYTIHRLVAEAYIPNPENKEQVNHKNGNPSDNRVENLEWCTRSENAIHAWKTGLNKNTIGRQLNAVRNGRMGCKIVLDYSTGVYYNSISEAYKYTKYSLPYLAQMLTGYYPNKTSLRYV